MPDTLFDPGPSITVKRCRSNLHAQPCWHAYCGDCGKTLSAYDDTEEMSREGAASEPHDCPKRPRAPAPSNLTGEFPEGY